MQSPFIVSAMLLYCEWKINSWFLNISGYLIVVYLILDSHQMDCFYKASFCHCPHNRPFQLYSPHIEWMCPTACECTLESLTWLLQHRSCSFVFLCRWRRRPCLLSVVEMTGSLCHGNSQTWFIRVYPRSLLHAWKQDRRCLRRGRCTRNICSRRKQ